MLSSSGLRHLRRWLAQIYARSSIPGSLTLRSKAVAALIRAAWTFQVANPSRSVLAALVTTGKIGKEKGPNVSGKVSGLSYWRVAARDQADIEPMRTALLTLDFPPIEDISERSHSRRYPTTSSIDRSVGSVRVPSQDEKQHEIHEQLVDFGSAWASELRISKNALNALIVELMTCMPRQPSLRFRDSSRSPHSV